MYVRAGAAPPPLGTRPTGRSRTRNAVQRVHFDPRIVSDGGEPAARREIAGFGDGILDVRRTPLEIHLLGEARQELIGGKDELERQAGEEVADLARLAGAARRDEKLHARSFRTRSVVDFPATSGTRTTRPPHPSTSAAPTIASGA